MSLLTPADIALIHSSIRSVTDTFFKLKVTYKRESIPFDVFNEDRQAIFTDYELDAQAMQEGNSQVEQGNKSSVDLSEKMLSFNVDYLREMGMLDAQDNPIFSPEKDYMIIENVRYRIIGVGKDGQLVDKYLLVNVLCKRHENNG